MSSPRIVKHAIDRSAACVLGVILAPLLAIIAVAIRLDSPGSPFFLQERVGAGGRSFTIFKFRTMRQGSETDGLGASTATDDDRITRVGRWLRATSLDELPQLFNIARGEMSFIGPRPTLRYQVDLYTAEQKRRLLFRPGVTGWAQIHGRNDISWERRIALDLWYIDHHSLWLDLEILLRTVLVLLRRDGIYARGGSNDAFVGSPVDRGDVARVGDDAGSLRAFDLEDDAPFAAEAGSVEVLDLEDDVLIGSDAGSVEAPDRGDDARSSARGRALLPLLVIGAGGHARVIVDIAEKQGRYRVVGLIDDQPALVGTRVLGHPVLGGREVLGRPDIPAHVVVAIGSPDTRAAWQEHLEECGFQLAVLVHPSAQIGREVTLGAGTVLMAGAIVNSGSRIGRGVIVNTASSVDHDCEIGDFVHIAPGARLAGGVRVGPRAHIGIGAVVLQNRVVGDAAIVGGGAAVVHSVPDRVTVAGVPARPVSNRTVTPANAPA